MRQIILFFLFIISYAIFADTTSDTSKIPLTDKYKETIEYGIEKEVVSILKKLGYSPHKNFFPLLFERYKEASLVDTQTELINYFSKCDNLPDNIIKHLFEQAKSNPDDTKLHSTLLNFVGKKGKSNEGLLLIKRLDHDEDIIKIVAADALSSMKNIELIKPILDRLELSEKDDEKYLSTDIKSKLILSFGKMKAKESVKYLRKIISESSNDKYMIMYSMVSLAEIGDVDSINIIEKNLKSENVKTQEYAGYSLSLFKAKSAIPILKKMLKNNREKIRMHACQGLVLNNDIDSIKILLYKFTKDPSPMVKKEALSSLIYLGNAGINALKAFMKNKKYSDANLCVISDAVSKKPESENVQFLIYLYDSIDIKKKGIIAKYIINGNSNKLDPIIKKLLSSENYLIRISAIKAVYRIKSSSLWSLIKNLSQNDPSSIVKKIAKSYLGLKAGR